MTTTPASYTWRNRHPARIDVWGVRAAAAFTALMGVVNLLSAVTPPQAERLALLEEFSPLEVRQGGHLTAALAGFALMLLASNLWRRKRVAWLITLAVLALSAVSHLIKGLDYEEAALSAALTVLLIAFRSHYHALSDRPSIRRGLLALTGALLFTLVYGVAGFYLLDRHFSVNFGFLAAVEQTVIMFTQFYDPGLQPVTAFGRYFADSIYAVGAATLGYALLMLVRPVLVREPATSADRARAGAIVEAHGRSSLARLTLFDDKSYFFSPGGSVVAYTAKGRAAVALGDPIGPAQDAANAIAGFSAHCARNDWRAAFYQTRHDTLDLYTAAGFRALCIGHEAIVGLASFTLEGKAGKDFRAALNKLNRLGHRAELFEPPLAVNLLDELRSVSDEWLATTRGAEKHFSVGWFDDDYIRHSQVMAVWTPGGSVSAFVNIIPEYRRNEVTLDLMRRRRQIENGTMDFLFVSLFEWAKAQGSASFSLGLSALSGVGEHSNDPAVERALHYIYEHISRFYNFKGLHAFKEKFSPRWEPRYLIHPGQASLPSVSAALLRADSGDDFWSPVALRSRNGG